MAALAAGAATHRDRETQARGARPRAGNPHRVGVGYSNRSAEHVGVRVQHRDQPAHRCRPPFVVEWSARDAHVRVRIWTLPEILEHTFVMLVDSPERRR